MKASSRIWLLVLVELSLFVVDQQAPILYVWHMQAPELRILGRVDASVVNEKKSLSPWKRNALPEQEPLPTTRPTLKENRPAPPPQENKRDVSLEDILSEEDHRRPRGKSIRPVRKDQKKNLKNLKRNNGWPNGTYGIPRAASGCPNSTGFQWKTGFRFHDTADDFTDNQQSESYHLAGKISDDGIRQEFCMKTDKYGNRNWPEGKYCIYKKGPKCPHGLEHGFVIWDDENKDNRNTAEGTLPEGIYNEDTKIEFCCSTTGDWDDPIVLPTEVPFYLFAFESTKCQKVAGMDGVSEFVKFDDQDRGNTDYQGGRYPFGIGKGQVDHRFFLCYYTPIGKVWDTIVEVAPMPSIRKSKHKSISKSHHKSNTKKIDKLEEMEKLRSSEKMMDAFLAVTSQNRDETDKSERTKTIIKTIRVPERIKDSTTTIIATTMGVILGAFLLGSVILIFIARHMKNRQHSQIDSMEDRAFTYSNSSRRSSFATSDDEIDLTEGDYEDELVEDQYLPSDSELKSGLELMFLKQQRHYWTRDRKQ